MYIIDIDAFWEPNFKTKETIWLFSIVNFPFTFIWSKYISVDKIFQRLRFRLGWYCCLPYNRHYLHFQNIWDPVVCQVLVFYVVFFSIVLTVHRRFTHSMHLLMSSNLSSEPSALKVMLLFLDCWAETVAAIHMN